MRERVIKIKNIKSIEEILNVLNIYGNSMLPYLREGEKVFVCKYSPEELTPGVIIAFRCKGRNIVHRIVGEENGRFITQGDANLKPEKVLPSNILGVVKLIERKDKILETTDNRTAKLYWQCWRRLTPVRRYLLWAYRIYRKAVA